MSALSGLCLVPCRGAWSEPEGRVHLTPHFHVKLVFDNYYQV